ncbi:hypothetical protein Zmor_004405 [Zophobas morio]|uniref:DDE Tnp4 domain-containing protein n=1 Tax=Zophobas morio TaxID=2755281 RepID=A0AA38M0W7_9CUCU|nr:hypothetical protein Zmor_004405 [Zophobas morio]
MGDLVQQAVLNAEEEIEIAAQRHRPPRFHTRDDPFQLLSDAAFLKMYRMTKELAQNIIDLVDPYIVPQTRCSALDTSVKVLTALRFFASGSYQLDIGKNVNSAVSQASTSQCINEVVEALNQPQIFDEWVKFPQNFRELNNIRNEFYQRYQFPGVIGCVDCTHVAIVPPKSNDAVYPEHIYVNRKNYHSINVQLVCDANLRILNVNARYPGSTHDSFIWNNSNVLDFLQNLHTRGHSTYYVLGDSGYALRPWLMTPIQNVVPNTPEGRYNESQKRTRSIIERCNGVLKMRFRCLLKHRVLHYHPEKAGKIIKVCVVLHNMCIANNVEEQEDNDEVEVDFGMNINDEQIAHNERVNPQLAAGRTMQARIIRNYF